MIVESDDEIRELAPAYLFKKGMVVSGAKTSQQMVGLLQEWSFDIIVLGDVETANEKQVVIDLLRQDPGLEFPILIIGSQTFNIDRKLSLRFNSVDVLQKPFSGLELLSRVQTIVRRNSLLPPIPSMVPSRLLLQFGDWRLDLLNRILITREGVEVSLSGGERQLLEIFIQRPRRALSLDDLSLLLARLGSEGSLPVGHLVRRLGKRLGMGPDGSLYLQTLGNGEILFATSIEPTVSEAA
jgi:two-component system OmpR family response regulator